MLESIRHERLWFEVHEPSSPTPVLLRRAEGLVGKGHAQIAQAILADLPAQSHLDG